MRDTGLIPGSGRPLAGAWQPTPVFLSGESHGQRSLTGYSPCSGTESGMTQVTLAYAGRLKPTELPCLIRGNSASNWPSKDLKAVPLDSSLSSSCCPTCPLQGRPASALVEEEAETGRDGAPASDPLWGRSQLEAWLLVPWIQSQVLILSECAPPWGYPSPVGSSWLGYVQPPWPEIAVRARAMGFTTVHSKGDPGCCAPKPVLREAGHLWNVDTSPVTS